ncbi:MAG: flagellar motor switch protein FliG [Deltaproteobacteria bacterium]|nr:flagellar motor switch protein FliG [Deltaproteobacteria bacterium]
MTNEEKAALVLLSLGEEMAASVMKNLGTDEIRRVGTCMNKLTEASRKDIEYAAGEFNALVRGKKDGALSVQDTYVENVIMKALGEAKGKEFIRGLEDGSFLSNGGPIIEKLRSANPRILANFTKTEHPQTIALILSYLQPEQVADILENLSPDRRHNIIKRIATLGSVPREFLEEMTKTLESEMIRGGDSEEHAGGVQVIAEILNRMSRESEKEILESLEEAEPDLATEIRNRMFTFDDIFALDGRNMRMLLEEVDREDLPRALKIVDDETKEKVFDNLSKRAAEMLREDISIMPPIRLSEVETSQRTIIDIAKRLEAEDKITFSGGGGKDEFV